MLAQDCHRNFGGRDSKCSDKSLAKRDRPKAGQMFSFLGSSMKIFVFSEEKGEPRTRQPPRGRFGGQRRDTEYQCWLTRKAIVMSRQQNISGGPVQRAACWPAGKTEHETPHLP